MSDNGPQYSAEEFVCFAKEYEFQHLTSSLKFPQANGEAERAVKTIKAILRKTDDPYLGLLAYRSTPLENGYSPAELLMGRKIRSTVPVIPKLLHPELPNHSQLCSKERKIRDRQKRNFDSSHQARSLEPLVPGETVWLPDSASEENTAPRTYIVQTPTGQFWRNRRHIVSMPPDISDQTYISQPPTSLENSLPILQSSNDPNIVRTCSGRVSRPPDRFS